MAIDWFTFTAQVINFLILVWLLHRFLYEPITRTMQQRQDRIAAALADAETARADANREAERHRGKIAELDHTREQLLAEAGAEVRDWRDEQLRHARSEVDDSRRDWYRALAREKQTFAGGLRRRVVHHVQQLTRKLLQELSTQQLEDQALSVFLDQLGRLDPEQQSAITTALSSGDNSMVVTTAFVPSDEQQARVIRELSRVLPSGGDIRFRTRPELICGVELHAAGSKLSWCAAESLEALDQEFTGILDDAAARHAAAIEPDGDPASTEKTPTFTA